MAEGGWQMIAVFAFGGIWGAMCAAIGAERMLTSTLRESAESLRSARKLLERYCDYPEGS